MIEEMTELRKLLAEQAELLAEKDARIAYLEEQFRLAQQKRFGVSSESHPGQGELFNEAEVEAEHVEEESNTQTISYTRKTPTRQSLPKDLPRETVVHDIADEDKVCDCCGGELHQMGEAKSEKLEFIPAQVKVIEHVRPKYSCRTCEQQGIEVKVKIAPLPASPIPKGIATASLLSQIITSKYQYGLPLYRQESLFKQYGIELSRSTMADWMIKCSALFKPLIERLKAIQLEQPVIQADETTLKVINEDKSTCYMWLYCTGTDLPNENPIPNIVLYDYQNTRSGRCAVDYLGDYSGYLQVDGYQGYEQTQATLAGCWAHARRKFKEAEVAQGKGKTGKANWALNHIQKLYRIETHLKGQSAQQKYQLRQTESLPLLNQYKAWLDKSVLHVPPKTALGKALGYSLNQWQKLVRYVDDGNLNIDNNRAERAIKPFVIGRKNWLFSNATSGANASAILYSIIETAKANGLTPFDYIMHCLEHLAASSDNVEDLLPWNVKLGKV
jgi:transposase